MEPHRFDDLVTQLATARIGRRRFLFAAAALGLGISGASAAPTAAPGANNTQAQTTPFNPFDWFCWPGGPGPTVPWFPVVPDPATAFGTRVRLYGVHLDETAGMTMAAFGDDGQEVSRCEMTQDADGTYRFRFADDSAEATGSMLIAPDAAGVRVGGDLNGTPIDPNTTTGPVDLPDTAQRRLMRDWEPLAPEFDGLLDVLAATDDGTATAGGAKCAAAGYLAGFGCLVSVGALGVFGVSTCVDNAESLYDTYCT